MNQTISINLLTLKNACLANLQGKTGMKKCLVVPVDDAKLYIGQKGVYLDLVAFESDKIDGVSHFIKQSISQEERNSMSEEERNSLPIMGNVKPLTHNQVQAKDGMTVDIDSDLPF